MIIYGVALLAICTLLGLFVGDLLGVALGVKANVGGVGFAMLLLILIADRLQRTQLLPASIPGIGFWTAMYIPIVVAMAAQQNVVAALKGGPAAVLAGVLAVVVSFALIPAIDRIGRAKSATQLQPADQTEQETA
ncbi:malonate transporter subunit MadL [Paraherbaspirillum soli]|uniref:Malonate transporter subunit MadL n=1 Tax=Paraherbaspirillum soli TaxID=631222 RepID=A0ABW0MFQ0_9BURK